MTLLQIGTAIIVLSGWSRAAPVQDYQLGPDDVLSITVLRHPEWSVEQVTVTSAGKVSLPVVGEIFIAGKTISQVDNQITQTLRNRIRHPEVTVTLKEARPARVFVLGTVVKPAAYDIKPGWRVSEALAVAGGLSGRPEVIEGTLSRSNSKPLPLDVLKLLSNSSDPANVPLRAGDTLQFSARTIKVFVSGEVQKAGGYEVTKGESAAELIAQAGGPTEKAALKRVVIQRAGKIYPVDAYLAVKQGTPAGFDLQDGDFMIVPENKQRILVMPSVQKPGYYPIPEDGKMT
ncbi:MAG: polysaccharide biosynthesis/export family protein, partial [Armatimonadota bacterium]|nr:polysaccharide biosynthesis/export family protein [Armatimonadota bacterium]